MKNEIFSEIYIIEDMIHRFPHMANNIFKKLDTKDLKMCLKVSLKWSAFIHNQRFPWKRTIRKVRELYKQTNNDEWNKVLKVAQKSILKHLLYAIQTFFENNSFERKSQWTPLHIAAYDGNLNLFIFIIDKTKNENTSDQRGIQVEQSSKGSLFLIQEGYFQNHFS